MSERVWPINLTKIMHFLGPESRQTKMGWKSYLSSSAEPVTELALIASCHCNIRGNGVAHGSIASVTPNPLAMSECALRQS